MSNHVNQYRLGKVRGPNLLCTFGDGQRFMPDLVWIGNGMEEKFAPNSFNGLPEMVVEILSPKTRKHDLETKRPWYRKYGVKEIYFIDPDKQTIECDRLACNEYVTETTTNGVFKSPLLPFQFLLFQNG